VEKIAVFERATSSIPVARLVDSTTLIARRSMLRIIELARKFFRFFSLKLYIKYFRRK